MTLFGKPTRPAIVSDARRPARPLWTSPGTLFDLGLLLGGDRFRHEAQIRSLCQTAYLGDHTALCRVLGRYKMYVDTRDVGMASHLMLDGYWEMWNTEALLRTMRAGMTAIDIGAHCGYFSLLMSDLVGPTGRVLAFEPNPPIVELLRRTLDVNGFRERCQVHEVALGDRSGGTTLVVPEHEPKNAHVVPAVYGQPGITVDERRLDSFEVALQADVIKIDAEAAEERIWRGMTGLLEQNRPLTILLEFTPGRYASAEQFLDEILGFGFRLGTVSFVDGIVPTTREAVLGASPIDDQMLVLSR